MSPGSPCIGVLGEDMHSCAPLDMPVGQAGRVNAAMLLVAFISALAAAAREEACALAAAAAEAAATTCADNRDDAAGAVCCTGTLLEGVRMKVPWCVSAPSGGCAGLLRRRLRDLADEAGYLSWLSPRSCKRATLWPCGVCTFCQRTNFATSSHKTPSLLKLVRAAVPRSDRATCVPWWVSKTLAL